MSTLRARLMKSLLGVVGRCTALTVFFLIFIASIFYSGSSASTKFGVSSRESKSVSNADHKATTSSNSFPGTIGLRLSNVTTGVPMLFPQNTPATETVTTYASDCMTPKSSFNFGETVCAKIDGGIPLSISSRRFSWVSPDNVIRSRADVTTLPQTDSFTIPARDPDNDLREVWRVNSISSRSSVRASAFFTVSDPNDAVSNLSIYDNVNTNASEVTTDSDVEFALWIVNRGPDTASNVEVNSLVTNASFVSASQDSGPPFSCNPSAGGVTCTIATLTPGSKSRISLLYHAAGGVSVGTVITNTADISSGTPDAHLEDNSSTAKIVVSSGGSGGTCSLVCPGNITKTATTTQNNVRGAVVTFDSEASGDCGVVTASPASGTFFPVGDTTVTVSGDGASCTFTVTVTDSSAPTISCPANVVKDAGNSCSAEVSSAELSSPTTTGNQVVVDSDRSDGLALDAPYPAGVTTITWTATDADGRTATCSQTVTVNGSDSTPPTITAPPNVIDTTGSSGVSCGKIIGETELGTADTADNCSTVNVLRQGVPPGNFFPIGTTTITYRATDSSGNVATATQTVTVSDDTKPIIFAPADASYVCPSEVPAADVSQATGPDVIDANGQPQPGPPSDNCGSPTLAVSEVRSGAGSASDPMIISRTFTATDAANNVGSATQTITVIDPTPPSISLNGASSMTVECHTSFTDPGATASDNCTASVSVSVSGSVNVNTPGTYTLTYNATDDAGNHAASLTRTVIVVDTIAPTLALNGANPMTVECHTTFADPGATASDSCAGDLTSAISATGSVNANVPGTYTVTYTVSDGNGHTSTLTRTVNVVDRIAPTINLNGRNITLWPPNHAYRTVNVTDLVASVSDSCDLSLGTSNVVISRVTSDETENGDGDGNTLNDIVIAADCKSVQLRAERNGGGNGRVYTITFRVRDASGNIGTATANVTVPKNQGSGGAAVDDGPHYTVTSNCP